MNRQPAPQINPKKRGVYLVEDHPITQQGLCALLNLETDLKICGQATTAEAAMPGISSTKPDLVIVDIALPGRDGIELIKSIAVFHPKLPTLVLSTLDESIYAERALRAGAMGYIMKHEPVELLLRAVHQVLAGKVYLSEAVRNKLFQHSIDGLSQGVEQLTDREIQVFRLIGEGFGTREIAERLGLSISTVETHRTNIKDKLGAKNAPDLAKQAVTWQNEQKFKS
jgi:DNA-binding NarL/FixJ family response regulator